MVLDLHPTAVVHLDSVDAIPNIPQPKRKQPEEPITIPSAFDAKDSEESAKKLVRVINPEWKPEDIKLTKFTDGITNTLLKCSNKSHHTPDDTAVLLRAYGSKTDVLIDRERECNNHLALASFGLAPRLIARFHNGLLYSFVPGDVCTVEQMSDPEIYSAVARRLGEWHGTVPVKPVSNDEKFGNTLWGIMRRWADALPVGDDKQRELKNTIEEELKWLCEKLGNVGVQNGLIFGHCDLLNGNVIILPQKSGKEKSVNENKVDVHFIDYEYATPCPAAFDLANHFAEWVGFRCDYNLLPSKSQRRAFITDYLISYHAYKHQIDISKDALEKEVEQLEKDVDTFRGIPGFYWGIWALIQAQISQIDFDYAGYAEKRLSEYWDWKKTLGGKKSESLREQVWGRE